MAEVKLTTEQQAVVDARDCSLLVAAAAGSGKTAVLVKRIIDKLTDKQHPASIDRMLIVTFTKAAAAEMRERIGDALDRALEANPDDDNIRRQVALLPTAQISTIDSFCAMVVNENYFSLDIDPGYVIADENELELLMDDVLEGLLDEEYAEAKESFGNLVTAYTSHKDDKNIKTLIKSLFAFADSDPRPEEWLDRAVGELDILLSEGTLIKGVMEETKRIIADCILMADGAETICNENCGPKKYITGALTPDKQMFQDFLSAETFDELQAKLINRKFVTIPSVKKDIEKGDVDEVLALRVQDIRKKYKERIKNVCNIYFLFPFEIVDKLYQNTKPAMLELIRLTREFMTRFDEAKAERNTYGFSDIEHFAHRILCERNENADESPSDLAKELVKRYDEIMIDEYQDSSLLQENILKAVSGEFGTVPNLFMVGDVKQSIYGFRKARPELFIQKYREFTSEGLHRKIDLTKNFRSRKCVLDVVNVLMSSLMHENISEIEYDERAALHFGSSAYTEDTDEYIPELILIDKETTEEENENIEMIYDFYDRMDSSHDEKLTAARTTPVEREALAVAMKIKALVSGHFQVAAGTDKEGNKLTRDIGYGDIAVLCRSGKGVFEVYTKVFTKLLIPSSAETGTGFFDSVEVKKVLSFLRILDNPYQDIAFAAVLYSPFAGMNSEEMARLTATYGNPLYEAARRSAENGNEKLTALFDIYDKMAAFSEYMTVHEVIEKLYEVSGYQDTVTVMPQGDRRRGNLDMLVRLAKEYEKSSFTGIHDFLRYIDRLNEEEKDFGESAPELSEGCVRIMTIHKSKGLEFPVVFLCQMGRKFNSRDSRGKVIFDQDYGIGSEFVDLGLRTRQDTLKQKYLQRKIKRASKSEEIRVLYVALTRAKEKLFMVGTIDDVVGTVEGWRNTLDNGIIRYTNLDEAGNYLDMIGPRVFNDFSLKNTCEDSVISCKERIGGECGNEHFETDIRITLMHFDEDVAYSMLESESAEPESATKEIEPKECEGTISGCYDSEKLLQEIEKRRSFRYVYAEQAAAPMKVSVSELKMIAIHDSEEEKAVEMVMGTPAEDGTAEISAGPEYTDKAFGKSKRGATGAERGTLYHEVFEKLRYTGNYCDSKNAKESLTTELETLISEGFLPDDVLDTVSLKKLTSFCMSPVGQRIINAAKEGKLYREQPFVYGLTADEYKRFSKTSGNVDTVMLQGIIDAYIDEPDGLVLIDYKTDKVVENAERELGDRYHVQLELYAKALSKLRGKPVKEMIIYSVAKNEEISL